MTRKTDRLEVLAHDLASRYGEDDALVLSVRAEIPQAPLAQPVQARPAAERRLHAQGPFGRKKPAQALHIA